MIRDLLLLARAPLALSAAVNMGVGVALAAAGAGAAGAAWPEGPLGPALALLALASLCLYWAGMVLNDLFDRRRDQALHPERPLPAGRVTVGTAAGLGMTLLGAGVGLAGLGAWVAGSGAGRGLAAGGAVAACVLAYDGLLKRWRLPGSLAMGSCRLTNALLGATALGLWSPDGVGLSSPTLIYACALGAYVTFLTVLSTYEDEDAGPAALALSFAGVLAVPLLLTGLAVSRPEWSLLALLGALPLALVGLRQLVAAIQVGTQRRGGAMTRALIKAIWLLDAGFLLALGAWPLVAALPPLYLLVGAAAGALFRPPRPPGPPDAPRPEGARGS